MRRCSTCKHELPLTSDHFAPSSQRYSGGFRYECRSCRRAAVLVYRSTGRGRAKQRMYERESNRRLRDRRRAERLGITVERLHEIVELREESMMLFHLWHAYSLGISSTGEGIA